MIWGFEEGRVYNRRADIHGRFGGQQQGGIITPSRPDYPVFIITGEEGEAHGYTDRRRADGAFEYFGEGQVGDMQMVRGNSAIRDHAENGRDLLLFRKTREGVRFEGAYVYEGHRFERAPDTNGTLRQAVVFELQPLNSVVEADSIADTIPQIDDISVLRDRALAAAKAEPAKGSARVSVFERSRTVCAYVFARAKGRCEDCGEPAPFFRENGFPYLEAHHIRRLTDGGPDDPRFMIALCPNCHRRAHHGADRINVNARMQSFVTMIERR